MNLTSIEFALFYKQSILHIFHPNDCNTCNKKQESKNGFIPTPNDVYRHVHDSLLYTEASHATLHSKHAQNSVEKQWNDAAASYYPNFSCYIRPDADVALNYIRRILKLPHRLWNQEWESCRKQIIKLESLIQKKLRKIYPLNASSCNLTSPTAGTPFLNPTCICSVKKTFSFNINNIIDRLITKLVNQYEKIIWIQQHFLYISAAVFFTLMHSETRDMLGDCLSEYYAYHLNQQNTGEKVRKIFHCLDCLKTPRNSTLWFEKYSKKLHNSFIELNENAIHQDTILDDILNFRAHRKQVANNSIVKSVSIDSSSNVLHWVDHGFEFQGIWFKSVKDVSLWKTVKREIVFTNEIFFNKDYSYAPLVVCFAAWHCQLMCSALRIDRRNHEENPPQVSLKLSKHLIDHLNFMIRKGMILPHIKKNMKRIIYGLKNPDLLLTMYSPCYIPINTHSSPANARTIIAISLEALSNALVSLKNDITSTNILNFEQYMYFMLQILYGKTLFLKKLALAEQTIQVGNNVEETKSLERIKENTLLSISKSSVLSLSKQTTCDNVTKFYNKLLHCPLYALGFSKQEGHKLLHILTEYDQHFLLNLCSNYFQCDAHYVLPFDPIKESQTEFVFSSTPWKTNILGYPCAVWISTQSYEKSQHVHSLFLPFKKTLKKKKNYSFFRFPWNTNNFVFIPGQIPFYERAASYIQKCTKKKKNNTLQQLIHLIDTHSISSSIALHEMIHSCQRSVSKTLWEVWILSQETCAVPHSVVQVIACDLVASSARLVFQYYSTDSSCVTTITTKAIHLLQIFFFLFFGLKSRPLMTLDDTNTKTVEQLLHIALWFSLLNVKYMIDGPFDSFTILKVYDKAKENPQCLLTILFEQLYLNTKTLSFLCKLPWEQNSTYFTNQLFYPIKGWRTYNHGNVTDFLLKSPNEHTICHAQNASFSENIQLNFNAIMSPPTYFKINLSLRPQSIILHLLTFLCFQQDNSSFSIKLLYGILGQCAGFSTVAIPLDDDIFHYFIAKNNFNTFPVFLSTLEMIKNQIIFFCFHEKLVESVIVVLFHLLFSELDVLTSDSSKISPCVSSIERICVFLQEQEGIITNPYIKGYNFLLQGLSGLVYLTEKSKEETILDFFYKAIHCFVTTCGNPSCVLFNGWSILLYPCWILAHYLRLKEANTEALMYEMLFRISRGNTRDCSLIYTFPHITVSQSNTSVLGLLRSQHECFILNKTIPWLCSLYTYHATSLYYVTDFCLTGNMSTFLSPVLSFGSNMSGCLGLGYPIQTERVSFSPKRTHCKNNEDIWWTLQPTPVHHLKKSFIVNVASGGHHCLALTNDGRLWSWGSNSFGELGSHTEENACENSHIPLHQCNWYCNFYDTCEESHSGVSSKKEKSKLNATILASSVLRSNANLTSSDHGEGCTKTNESVPHLISAEPTKLVSFQHSIQSISCGYNYSSAITLEGVLFMWGCNAMGQLGLNDYYDRWIPTQVTQLTVPVVKVSCGYSHTAVIAKNNSLWCWGSNTYGQVGFPFLFNSWNAQNLSTIPCNCPFPVELCLLEVYAENGMNETNCSFPPQKEMEKENQVWRQDKEQIKYYITNTTFSSEEKNNNQVEFLSVACGSTHTLAIDLCNTVWSWGSNFFGELGQQDAEDSLTFNIIKTSGFLNNLPSYETEKNIRVSPCRLSKASFFSYKRIHKVFAGRFSSSAIDENATAWFWGTNLFNNLAIHRNDLLKSYSPIQSLLLKNDFIDNIVYDWNGTHQAIITSTHEYALWGEEDDLLIRNKTLKKKKMIWSFPTQRNKVPKSLESLEQIFTFLSLKKENGDHLQHEILPVTLPKIKSTFPLTQISLGLHHALFCLHTSLSNYTLNFVGAFAHTTCLMEAAYPLSNSKVCLSEMNCECFKKRKKTLKNVGFLPSYWCHRVKNFVNQKRDFYISPSGQKILVYIYSIQIGILLITILALITTWINLKTDLFFFRVILIYYISFYTACSIFLELLTRLMSGYIPFDKPWLIVLDSFMILFSIMNLFWTRYLLNKSLLIFVIYIELLIIRNVTRLIITIYLFQSVNVISTSLLHTLQPNNLADLNSYEQNQLNSNFTDKNPNDCYVLLADNSYCF